MLQFMLNMIRECLHPYGGELARRIARLRQPPLLDLSVLNFSLMREGPRSWSCRAVIRVYDDAANMIETHEHAARLPRALHAFFKKSTAQRDSIDNSLFRTGPFFA